MECAKYVKIQKSAFLKINKMIKNNNNMIINYNKNKWKRIAKN